MKNSTIVYIVFIAFSTISPLIMFPHFDYLDLWISYFYIIASGISLGAIITAFLKDSTSKHLTLPILSIFVLLIALSYLSLGIYFLIIGPRYQPLGGEGFLTLFVLAQIGLLVAAIKHILPQKIEPNREEEYEIIEI